MEKMKLLTVFLLCLGIAGIAWSTEVISIDINGDDYAAYTGMAVYPDANDVEWRAYYEGFGKPMGSVRSADLPDYNEPNIPSTYAAGVWIGDPGSNHGYVTGTGLMDDGFDANGVTEDPCLYIFGWANNDPGTGGDPNNRDGRAFGGTYDIYVYSANDGNFWLSTPTYSDSNSTTGGYTGTFVEGQNYVVFGNVLIDDTNSATLVYDGVINGLQLVSKKEIPTVTYSITTGFIIEAEDYDVAYETNQRNENPGTTRLGPDIGDYGDDITAVGYLDHEESMTYDLIVDSKDSDGIYELNARVKSAETDQDCVLYFYLDGDIALGTLTQSGTDWAYASVPLPVILFVGEHTLTWEVRNPDIYFDIDKIRLKGSSTDPNLVSCEEVYMYKKNYYNYDFDKDCDVDANDLVHLTESWLYCYSPDPNDCL
ncbi:MAG: hypothetical protein PVG93_04460 [Phycisphaerales bacterium]|jgi:hypothetical protein